MKHIIQFSSLTPTERVSLIETLPFWDLVDLKNTLESLSIYWYVGSLRNSV